MGLIDYALNLQNRRDEGRAKLIDRLIQERQDAADQRQAVGLAQALAGVGKGPQAPVQQPDGRFKTPMDPDAAAAVRLMQNPGSRGIGNQLATNVMDPAWQQQQQNAVDQGYATRQQVDMAASEEARRNQLFPGQLKAQDYAASQDQRDELRTMSYINNLSMDNAAKGHATTLAALQGGLKSEADLRNEYQKAPLLIKGAQAIGSFTMMKRALDENNPMALQSAIVGISQVQEPGLAVRTDDRLAYSGNNPVTDRLVQEFNTAVSGEGLTPGIKMRMLALGTQLAGVHARNIQRVTQDYQKLAINTPGARQDQVTAGVGIDWDMVDYLAELTDTKRRGPGSR